MAPLLWSVTRPVTPFPDFHNAYYPAGRLALEDPDRLYDARCSGFVNLPLLALLFVPLAGLERGHAQALFLLAGIVATLLAVLLILKLTNAPGWHRAALLGLFMINGPLYDSLALGNTTHFLLPLLAGALILLDRRHHVLAGVVLGFSALVKLPLFLFAPYFLLRRRWKVIAGFAILVCAASAASVAFFGVDLHRAWLMGCVRPFTTQPLAAYNVQSIDGFLARLLTDSRLTNWRPLEVDGTFRVVRSTMLLALFGATLRTCWRAGAPTGPEAQRLELSIVLCLALVTSPISWTHYYLLLLLPLALYLGRALAVPTAPWCCGLVAIGTLLISLPVASYGTGQITSGWPAARVFVSHCFFGGVLLLAVFLAARRRTSGRESSVGA